MLDRKDPLAWEMTPVIYSKWAEIVMPQLGYSSDEVSYFLLGSAIEYFLFDDGNAFAILSFRNDYHLIAEGMQRQILTRLDWETSLGVLPEDIQSELIAIKEQITGQDWYEWEQILNAHRPWRKLRNSVEGRIAKGRDLNDVYENHQKISQVLIPYWRQFLNLSGISY